MPITVLQNPRSVYNYFCTTGFIFLLGVGCVYCALGQSPTQQQKAGATNQTRPQQGAVVSPSPSQTAVEQPKASVETGKRAEQKDSGDQSSFTDWIQVGINGALLVIIGFQTAIYWQQRTMMKRQIENARITERAYIGVQQVVHDNLALGAVPVVRLTLINGGRTPAYNLKMPGHLTITKDGLGFPHERPEVSASESPTFLPAGSPATFSYPFPIELTQAWLHAIQTEQYHLFLHIEAHFVDVWGESQWTPFKFEYRAGDERWGGYKDPNEIRQTVEIS